MKNSTTFTTFSAATLLFVLSISSCNNKVEKTKDSVSESTFNLTAAKTEIETANKEFMALFSAIDSVGLANLYAQDAKVMMNGAPAISGRENIQAAFSGIMNSGISKVGLITVDVWGTEDFVTEEGELALFAGDSAVDKGKYLVLWKKEDGKWKLFRDIFNSNLQAE